MGSELVFTEYDLAAAIADVWEQAPQLQRLVVKLNQGFSGEGNALLELRTLHSLAPGQASSQERTRGILLALNRLSFQCPTETWEHFLGKVHTLGAIAEAFIEGNHKQSPSVQARITPFGKVEILSTHDQELGGPDGQIFLGCTFPAQVDYRLAIQEMGQRIGEELADLGALERFGVDFIAVPQKADGELTWDLNAIEINLP